MIEPFLLEERYRYIEKFSLICNSEDRDCLAQKATNDGQFSVKTAYELLCDEEPNTSKFGMKSNKDYESATTCEMFCMAGAKGKDFNEF